MPRYLLPRLHVTSYIENGVMRIAIFRRWWRWEWPLYDVPAPPLTAAEAEAEIAAIYARLDDGSGTPASSA